MSRRENAHEGGRSTIGGGATPRTGTSRSDPSFLIVGTPRSGTTLVQRLACELPGVRMPPETLFFGPFLLRLLGRNTFPLERAELREELGRYAAAAAPRELEVDVDGIIEDLGGRCSSPFEMFAAIVRSLAGEGAVFGEKTPQHLVWWRPLLRAKPGLKLVAVVREPRDVVASSLDKPWVKPRRMLEVWLADQWVFHQRQIARAAATLGPRRCLVVRYEDVVADPEAARRSLGEFLGTATSSDVSSADAARAKIVLPSEWWKASTFDAINGDRIGTWREALSPARAATVAAICRREMRRFGYEEHRPDPIRALARTAALPPAVSWERARFRAWWAVEVRRINRLQL